MIRIVAGINPANCISNNMYRWAAVPALNICLIQTPSPVIAKWVGDWMATLTALGAEKEANIPLELTHRFFRALVEEKMKGADFCLAFTSFNADIEMSETLRYVMNFSEQIPSSHFMVTIYIVRDYFLQRV